MNLSQEVTLTVIGSILFLVVAIEIIVLILVYQKKQFRSFGILNMKRLTITLPSDHEN